MTNCLSCKTTATEYCKKQIWYLVLHSPPPHTLGYLVGHKTFHLHGCLQKVWCTLVPRNGTTLHLILPKEPFLSYKSWVFISQVLSKWLQSGPHLKVLKPQFPCSCAYRLRHSAKNCRQSSPSLTKTTEFVFCLFAFYTPLWCSFPHIHEHNVYEVNQLRICHMR